MSVTWTGVDNAVRMLRTLRQATPRMVGGALYREGERIMTVSKTLVPVDTGVLRASGHVKQPEYGSGRVTVVLGYGGAAAAYARVQHERTDFHHTVGQAKYLEQPVLEAAAGFANRIAAGVR